MEKITFEKLIGDLAAVPELIKRDIAIAITKSAVEVHKTAIDKFGKYQPAYGPFQAWAVLAPSTIEQKLKAGSAGDDPLIGHYVKGKKNKVYPTSLRQSITMNIDENNLMAQVGTNNPLGKYHEYGTIHIPPRPFLRPALYQNQEYIKTMMRIAIGSAMENRFK